MYLLILCIVNSRPHPRPNSQSVSLLPFFSLYTWFLCFYTPFRAIPFLFTLLRTLWHAPKLNSFFSNDFRTLCRETPGGGGTDSLRQRLQPDSASLASFRHPVPYTS